MHRVRAVVCGIALLALAGCENLGTAAQSKTNQGALLGGLLGAGTGAIIGNQTGHHAGAGTAIGGALGALGGGLIGHALEEQSQATQRQQFPPASPAPGTLAPVATNPATTGGVKFCPTGGETYPDSYTYCPVHGVELRYKEDASSSVPANPQTPQTTP